MDTDTTRNKDSYEEILSAFANQEADILVGTQMIVKGHDFPNVTLVGVLAADMSLYRNDFHGAERTFQLLTQAAGRAGRGKETGEVVIQTYTPEHYSIQAAKKQEYEPFYQQEILCRELMNYPPVWNLLLILVTSKTEEEGEAAAQRLKEQTDRISREAVVIGPASPSVGKVNDIYKRVLYIKEKSYEHLVEIKDRLEQYMEKEAMTASVGVQFDFNPMSGF